MTYIEQLEQMEKHLQRALTEKRFDTFKLLMGDRMRLIRQAMRSAERDEFLPKVQDQTARWVELLDERLKQTRKFMARPRKFGGYSRRSGRMINRSL
jgi:hypothetical protein